MTCIGSGFNVGATVRHKGVIKEVLAVEYVYQPDYSPIYPGKRLVMYLKLGNELVNPFDVVLISSKGKKIDKKIPLLKSICKYNGTEFTGETVVT